MGHQATTLPCGPQRPRPGRGEGRPHTCPFLGPLLNAFPCPEGSLPDSGWEDIGFTWQPGEPLCQSADGHFSRAYHGPGSVPGMGVALCVSTLMKLTMEGATGKTQASQSQKIIANGGTSTKENTTERRDGESGGHSRNAGAGRGALRVRGNMPHPDAGAPVAC